MRLQPPWKVLIWSTMVLLASVELSNAASAENANCAALRLQMDNLALQVGLIQREMDRSDAVVRQYFQRADALPDREMTLEAKATLVELERMVALGAQIKDALRRAVATGQDLSMQPCERSRSEGISGAALGSIGQVEQLEAELHKLIQALTLEQSAGRCANDAPAAGVPVRGPSAKRREARVAPVAGSSPCRSASKPTSLLPRIEKRGFPLRPQPKPSSFLPVARPKQLRSDSLNYTAALRHICVDDATHGRDEGRS